MLPHAPPRFPVDQVAQGLSLYLFLCPFHPTGPGRYSKLHKSEKEALVTLLSQLVLHQLQLLPAAQPEKLRPRESGSISESKTKLDRIQGPEPCLCRHPLAGAEGLALHFTGTGSPPPSRSGSRTWAEREGLESGSGGLGLGWDYQRTAARWSGRRGGA